MANDPITGACDISSQTQTPTTRPRAELQEHLQSGSTGESATMGSMGGCMEGQTVTTRESLKQRGKEAAHRMSAAVDETSRQVKAQAGVATRRIQEQGATMISQQKDRVASEIEHFGAAAHEAANKLDQEQDCNVAHYLHLAADQLDGVARYVRESDVNRLVDDAGQMVRRRPEVFFGGMFIAGMALARFLKASSRPRHREDFDEFEAYSAWDEDEFEIADEEFGAGIGTSHLHEQHVGAISGDIAEDTAGITLPRTPPTGPMGSISGSSISGGTIGGTTTGTSNVGEKKHGDKFGKDVGPSCPPGTAGQEVF